MDNEFVLSIVTAQDAAFGDDGLHSSVGGSGSNSRTNTRRGSSIAGLAASGEPLVRHSTAAAGDFHSQQQACCDSLAGTLRTYHTASTGHSPLSQPTPTRLVAAPADDTALNPSVSALRGLGKASRALEAVRAALAAAEAGNDTPRDVAARCSLVKLPRVETHRHQHMTGGHGTMVGSPAGATPGDDPLATPSVDDLKRPSRRSYFRVALDTSDEDSEDEEALQMKKAQDAFSDLVNAANSRSALWGKSLSRRGSGTTTPGCRSLSAGSPYGSPRSLQLTPGRHTGNFSPTAGGVGGGGGITPTSNNRRSRNQRAVMARGNSATSSPMSIGLTPPVFTTALGGVITSDEADRIVAEHRATEQALVLGGIQRNLLARRAMERQRLERARNEETKLRDDNACEPAGFRKAVEVDATGHYHRVERKRRQLALRRAATNHEELVMQARLEGLTDAAKARHELEDATRRQIALRAEESQRRLALGQLEGDEAGARCRLGALWSRGLAQLSAGLRRNGGAPRS